MDIVEAVSTLSDCYLIPATPTDPFGLILWENVGYLISDERRREVFDLFAEKVGLDPARIVAADGGLLLSIAKHGGMQPAARVERWRTIARIVLEQCDGDLD